MVFVSRVVARTPGTTNIRVVDRAETILNPEQLNLRGEVTRAALQEGGQGYVAVSIKYVTPVSLDSVYREDFGKILANTGHGGFPVDLFTYPTMVVQLSDTLYPNPMVVERVPLYDEFSTPVTEGSSIENKLGHTVVIRSPNYYPADIRESLFLAIKGGRSIDASKLGAKGYEWFRDITKRALVIPQSREERVGEYNIDFLDVRIEGRVRETQAAPRGGRYDLMQEINEYFEGFRRWSQGSMPTGESRNSVDRFLRKTDSRAFRVFLESQRREQEGIGREQVKAGTIKSIGDYLDAEADINDMNSALNRTPPGGQLRPLLPYVFFKGVLFEDERPQRRVQHGEQNRIVTLYRVRYDGRFLTEEKREEAFSAEGADFSPSLANNSAIALS